MTNYQLLMEKMPRQNDKIAVLTLGCSKNTVDSEHIIGLLKAADFEITSNYDKTDILIINTCGFIKPAKEESTKVILDACELKRQGRLKKLIVSGCLSERYMKELKEQIPDVDYFLGINSAKEVIKLLRPDMKHELIGERELLTPGHYAYLKISEGCNHNCSFCAIPLIKGKYKSRKEEDIIREAKKLAANGVKELNVIAQDTTYYGVDNYGKSKLAGLLKKLSDVNGIEWLRLLYTYPLNFPVEILDVINERENICRYIDIPLQHVSSKILKAMKRKMDYNQTSDLVDLIRDKIKNVAIRSTFITGFPGETDKDFQLLHDFIIDKKLERVGVFIYSQEEDTPAFDLGDTIDENLKNERRNILMEAQMEISLERNRNLLGKEMSVIIDEKDKNGQYIGRTEYDAPEVDNSVIIKTNKKISIGSFQNVVFNDATEYDLIAKI